ncbi:unnamed protein product, partial [Sphenostylis stenocarpa]
MGEKKVLGVVMVFLAYGLATTTVSEAQLPATCNPYQPLISPCVPYLVNPDFGPLTPNCCTGAAQVFGR